MLTHIDLFSGIGGFALAAKWAGFYTVAFVEIDEFCQAVIKKNFGSRSLVFGDIREFDAKWCRGATLLTGGFPCQPFSQAGKRKGKKDDRYLWPEMFRIIQEARPTWILGENVAGIIGMELDRCISGLEGEGYSVQPLVIPACAVDAKHRRDRVWIVGHADRGNEPNVSVYGGTRSGVSQDDRFRHNSWLPEPNVGRVANGIPHRVDRLRGLGNAIVPQVAYQILKEIAKMETA